MLTKRVRISMFVSSPVLYEAPLLTIGSCENTPTPVVAVLRTSPMPKLLF